MIELNAEETRVIEQAIQAGLIRCPDEVVEVGVDALRSRLEARCSSSSRQEAVRRMREFGDTYGLTLGEPVTRDLLFVLRKCPEGHGR